MDVKVREVCLKCGGTGQNQMGFAAALEEVSRLPRGGVIAPGEIAPPTDEARARALQACGYCRNGYNERWISLDELLSSGV